MVSCSCVIIYKELHLSLSLYLYIHKKRELYLSLPRRQNRIHSPLQVQTTTAKLRSGLTTKNGVSVRFLVVRFDIDDRDEHAVAGPRPHQPRLLLLLRSPQLRRPQLLQLLPRFHRRFFRLLSLISFTTFHSLTLFHINLFFFFF